ncbi:TMEM165/GDT1 family protein [Thioalkalivibrio sp. ALMg11]|uniref:TMEM165/GDT1 family protein n=1 Tax=Thioalkalivibrio sp. ALMg11 TaxID=1158165 RepID=UPI00036A6AF3|nr:TMEM165/GDT1 family protein [Thioalkalivibrio sp. ALMg11]
MEALLVATVIVAIAEMGDKTQLLALLLICRYQQTWPIIWGIVVATLANHFLAALAGVWIGASVPDDWLRWGLGIGFIVMAAWVLIPDGEDELPAASKHGVFWTTTVLFFLVEMGDKTQVATAALAATFDSLVLVVIGSTIGMVLANAPVVWLGQRFACHLPLRLLRALAALLFFALGLGVLLAWV